MKLYHGTPEQFNSFDLNYSDPSGYNTEGQGMYLASKGFAHNYGNLIEVNVPNYKIYDLTDEAMVRAMVTDYPKELLRLVGDNPINHIIKKVLEGYFCFSNIFRELSLILDNEVKFYNKYSKKYNLCDLQEEKEREWFSLYCFKYFDKDLTEPIYIIKSQEFFEFVETKRITED